MRRLRIFWIVALSAVLAAAAVAIDRLQQKALPRPPASGNPTAVEEAGEQGVNDDPAKPAPPQLSRRQRRVSPRIRAPRIAAPPAQSDKPRASPRDTARPDRATDPAPVPAPSDTRAQAPPEPPATGEQAPAVTVRAAPLLVPPVLLTAPSGYPADAYRIVLEGGGLTPQMKIVALEGRVVLRMFVQSDGTVGSMEIAESSGFDVLDRVAVTAARPWFFRPATRDGVPIDAWVLLPVRFAVP